MIRPKFLIVVGDLLLAYGCLVLGYLLRFGSAEVLAQLNKSGLSPVLFYLGTVALSAYFFDLYDIQLFKSKKQIIRRIFLSAITNFFLLTAIFYLLPDLQIGRGLLFLALSLLLVCQYVYRLSIRRFSRASRFANRTLIIGVGELAKKIDEIVPRDLNIHSYVGFVRCGNETPLVEEERIVGKINELAVLIHDYRPHRVIIALSERRGALPLKEIMHSKLRGVKIFDAATYFELQTGCLLLENMQPSAFIYTGGFYMTPFMRNYKRIFDLFFSLLGICLSAPLLPFIILLIKLESPGPALYQQLRVGEREVEYFVYKFRTMRLDAEQECGAVWAQKDDPRVTRVGKFLRKSRIDEIPQLYNVLKGDMSFIGPRPERLTFVDRLKTTIPYYSTRHFIKPGITGWAQVSYPYGASEEDALEKLRYDLFYIKNYSIYLDFKIIFATFKVVASGFGGR